MPLIRLLLGLTWQQWLFINVHLLEGKSKKLFLMIDSIFFFFFCGRAREKGSKRRGVPGVVLLDHRFRHSVLAEGRWLDSIYLFWSGYEQWAYNNKTPWKTQYQRLMRSIPCSSRFVSSPFRSRFGPILAARSRRRVQWAARSDLQK